jgi:hypothetical protein
VLALTGCSVPLTGTSGNPGAVENAGRVAFHTRVHGRRSFTASPGSEGRRFIGGRIPAGHCAKGSLTVGPIEHAVVDAYNSPTFVFHQQGQAAVDWTGPPQPGP